MPSPFSLGTSVQHPPEPPVMPATQYIPEQGKYGLRNKEGPLNNDHLCPDTDVTRPVVLLVYQPIEGLIQRHRDLHWSLGWEVSNKGFRLIHIQTHNDVRDPQPIPRYVYWGGQTKTAGNATRMAQKFFIGNLSLQQRQQIERIAQTVEVASPNGQWNCQNWIDVLLRKLVEHGVITSAAWAEAMAGARGAYRDCLAD
ncbi:hypothetical protein BD309DRAFT_923819 [Dichomitus squalens]|uniref:uncharacterized protein n=1 Tax=Dichomitus squalens (strain LYAD-421) TaxID=732165 RepID=UPI0004415D7A|nr:uncharacterized protein DICSQDRAFT_167652 [Dichomitus squalens LYAD-421 SS1]EJF63594.1 hypothetical protein DICSQDRAFT_167652 [Dichomitus squalens LYAD-421 SS1]TBU42297.1 hypothetical protein BD309DRAFT_923819 [Dichomitus squalens]